MTTKKRRRPSAVELEVRSWVDEIKELAMTDWHYAVQVTELYKLLHGIREHDLAHVRALAEIEARGKPGSGVEAMIAMLAPAAEAAVELEDEQEVVDGRISP